MQQENKNKIAEVFHRNIDNRITVELANGMLQTIFQIIDDKKNQALSKEESE